MIWLSNKWWRPGLATGCFEPFPAGGAREPLAGKQLSSAACQLGSSQQQQRQPLVVGRPAEDGAACGQQSACGEKVSSPPLCLRIPLLAKIQQVRASLARAGFHPNRAASETFAARLKVGARLLDPGSATCWRRPPRPLEGTGGNR